MGMGIPYGEHLVRRLERNLRRFNPAVTLTRRPRSATEFGISIANPDKEETDEGGAPHALTRIRLSREETGFYFGFAAKFGPFLEKTSLEHASLSVFSVLLGGEVVPSFRGEWDAKAAADDGSHHAQPHWHFVQSPSRIESIVRTLALDQVDFGETQYFRGEPELAGFHFAMSLRWQKPTMIKKDNFQTKGFGLWFDGLVSHLVEQIRYVEMKRPSRLSEFLPSE